MSKLVSVRALADPPGFIRDATASWYSPPGVTSMGANDAAAYQNRAMQIARGQVGSVIQLAVMMYFLVGNQLTIFNIIFLSSFGTMPFRNLFSMDQAFADVTRPGVNITAAKLLYVLLNLAAMGVLVWKIKAMGLLPVTSADWISLLPTRTVTEHAAAGLPM